jgi:RND family efflux transporter MFP subunit
MRKLSILAIVVLLIFAVSCGKSGKNSSSTDGHPPAKSSADNVAAKRGVHGEAGEKPKAEGDEEIDVDKLDIPDRLKQAIKSGRIPKERVKEMLAQFKEGGLPEAGGAGVAATPVSVAPVKRTNLNSYLVLNGVVEPERKVEIFSRLAAYVRRIVKEEGAYVKQGDILALLDDTEIKISYDKAKIELEQAKLSLGEAEQNYKRNKELIAKDLISEQEFQTQEATYKQRQLDYQNRSEDFKNLKLQLNWTKIRALSEGYITERLIEVGDRVNANEQVYTIEDFKPLLIRVYVPASDATQLKTKMAAEVTTEVLKGTIFSGDVKLINPRIDVQTGTVKVTVEVTDESLQLKPGMFVEVRIITGAKENLLVIPRKAVLYKQNRTYVFVMNNNKVSQREVSLGLVEEDQVEVTSGLKEDDVIVVVGVEGIKDGQRVNVIQ